MARSTSRIPFSMFLHEVRGLLHRFPALIGQLADFLGHDGEPPAVLARPGRFNGRVKRQ